jgi:hypothetical protein
MKLLFPFLIAAALTATATAQPAPGTPPAPGATAAKPKPFSAGDTNAYIKVAESMQFQLTLSLTLRGKFKDSEPEIVALGNKIHSETTKAWTPGVDLAQLRGVDGKKIPMTLSKNDKAALAKVATIKEEKKWLVAYFDLFAKESKKSAADAEKIAKAVQDPDLKAFIEKVAALLKSQSEAIEAKEKEVKARK